MNAPRAEHKLCGCKPLLYEDTDAVNERLQEAFALTSMMELCCSDAGDELDLLNDDIKTAALRSIQHLIAEAHYRAMREPKAAA